MLNQQDAHLRLLDQRIKALGELTLLALVEPSSRLIQQHNAGLADDAPADLNKLSQTVRKFIDTAPGIFRKSQPLEAFFDLVCLIGSSASPESLPVQHAVPRLEGDSKIFGNCHGGEQLQVLVRPAQTRMRSPGGGKPRDIPVLHVDPAARWPDGAGYHIYYR